MKPIYITQFTDSKDGQGPYQNFAAFFNLKDAEDARKMAPDSMNTQVISITVYNSFEEFCTKHCLDMPKRKVIICNQDRGICSCQYGLEILPSLPLPLTGCSSKQKCEYKSEKNI
jgi:hypothetical protein